MVQILLWLHSKFQELSNEYSHVQIRVKMKKLWPRQVGEEKQVAVQKLSRPSKLSRPGNLVAIKKKLCRDQKTIATRKLGRDQKKLCHDQLVVSRPKTLEKTKKGRKLIF